MDGIMLVLFAPVQNSNKLQWYRFGTGCLMIYCMFLAVSMISMDSNMSRMDPEYVKLESKPWQPYIEYPFPAISVISSLLLLPAVMFPSIEFRNYLIPAIVMNVYLALSFLANGAFTTLTLFYDHLLTTWPFIFLLYTSLTLLIHCLLIQSAISYYTLLWPDVLNGADNVAQIIEEVDRMEEEQEMNRTM